jgi:hypothetical protein
LCLQGAAACTLEKATDKLSSESPNTHPTSKATLEGKLGPRSANTTVDAFVKSLLNAIYLKQLNTPPPIRHALGLMMSTGRPLLFTLEILM